MKQSILRALALCLTTSFATGYAVAKDDSSKSSSDKSSSSSAQSSGSSSASGGPGSNSGIYSSTSRSSQTGQPVRLSKLMHTSIRGQAGDNLGQVQDVVLDPSSGQIQFVILSLNSSASGAPGSSSSTTSGVGTSTGADTTGIGSAGTTSGLSSGNLVAIPWGLVNQSGGTDQFTLNVDRTKLQSAPTFRSSSWPTMDSSWSQRVNSHFGVSATGAPSSSSGTSSGIDSSGSINPSTPGLPSTPGTPDLNSPSSSGTGTGTGIGLPGSSGTGTSGSGASGRSGSGTSGSSGSGSGSSGSSGSGSAGGAGSGGK